MFYKHSTFYRRTQILCVSLFPTTNVYIWYFFLNARLPFTNVDIVVKRFEKGAHPKSIRVARKVNFRINQRTRITPQQLETSSTDERRTQKFPFIYNLKCDESLGDVVTILILARRHIEFARAVYAVYKMALLHGIYGKSRSRSGSN